MEKSPVVRVMTFRPPPARPSLGQQGWLPLLSFCVWRQITDCPAPVPVRRGGLLVLARLHLLPIEDSISDQD